MKKLTKLISVAALTSAMLLSFNSNVVAQSNGQESVKAQSVAAIQAIVNINEADAETLSSLPGVGPKKAEAIISYRELNGNFQTVEELQNVKGIGKRMVEKLIDKVSV
uniref:ComEA family DNA-binding protein n=1 Tax=Ningiella ruwaisensis TaxID=2364274 RepID=UPI0010A00C16|nr:ComEA family DNA-binding protein [Ningiella ruwaisensis]